MKSAAVNGGSIKDRATSETIYPNGGGRFTLWGVAELRRKYSIAFCVHFSLALYQELGLTKELSIRNGVA